MPPDNAVVFKRKLSDALIRSLTNLANTPMAKFLAST
ncbi:hypothetical protein ALP97_00612 [Pseudomonas salomonii]|uniref:Uncharacterized protein n=1 Tax=Pseudomonas salomonii TaxID=191391 RepID=A0A3M4PV19_9PSED|nr:hypothetical protein ALP97_00612 [Pseudomonas salomonii]